MNKNYPKSKLRKFSPNAPRNDEYEGIGLYVYIYSKIVEPFPNAFDWDNQDFVDYCKANGITPKGKSTVKKQHNHFWFKATDNSHGKAYGFLSHIRNAFAHGLISIINIGKERYYVLNDYRQNKNQNIEHTMSGHIKCEYLWDMIELLLLTRNP